jgi:long-subunit acyl-CoA synthetase (AMP-forming)
MSSVLERLQAWADSAGSTIALHDGERTLTFAELCSAVSLLRRRFQTADYSVVALAGDNSIAWIVCDLALLGLPVRVVPIPAFFSPQQVEHLLQQAQVDAVVATSVELARVPGLNPVQWQLLDARLDLVACRRPVVSRYQGEYEKVTFTSGSTGAPKGVRLALSTLENTALSIADALQDVGIQRHLSVLPYATLLENCAGIYAPLLQGVTIHLRAMAQLGLQSPAQFNPLMLASVLTTVRPQATILVPQLLLALTALVQRGLLAAQDFRFIAVGGGKVSQDVLQTAEALGLPVYEGYGLSECGSVVTLNTPGQHRTGSVGKVLPHARIRIDDQGEILVSGAVMKGYLGEPDLAGDVVATGDLGHIDDEGFLYVSGRKKNLFITAFGRNVNPEWVEAELQGQLAIAQAAVFGEAMPHNVAIIVPRTGFDAAAVDTAVSQCNQRLPDYARIGRIVLAPQPFTDTNGMATPNGRIRRNVIAQQFSAELFSSKPFSAELCQEVADGILPTVATAD